MTRELPPPAAATVDDNTVELVRVWAARGAQHVSLATEIWEDPAAWGVCLVDVARHVARAYQQTHGRDPSETMSRLLAGFRAELERPTDEPKGRLVD